MGKYTYSPTVILDIDGVLVETTGNMNDQVSANKYPKLIDGTLDKLKEWDRMGCFILLVTGRPESARKQTEEMLQTQGAFYDQLVMGVGGGVRVLVNDRKPPNDQYPEGRITAFAVSPPRNHGIYDINIEVLEKQENDNLTELERQKRAWSDGAKSLN